MNAKITVTCYRSKILSNGEAPLMVKITKNGKRSLKTLGISLNPKYWDFERDKCIVLNLVDSFVCYS